MLHATSCKVSIVNGYKVLQDPEMKSIMKMQNVLPSVQPLQSFL